MTLMKKATDTLCEKLTWCEQAIDAVSRQQCPLVKISRPRRKAQNSLQVKMPLSLFSYPDNYIISFQRHLVNPPHFTGSCSRSEAMKTVIAGEYYRESYKLQVRKQVRTCSFFGGKGY